ncbi:MAG: hypothetical protein ACK5PS_11270 [Desulfopila sp.]
MNTLKALYFPGTIIHSASQLPLFLLFGEIHLLRPVEPVADSADIFLLSGLCQEHTPSPLGEGREHFLQLIKEIGERQDDYAAQLSALAIASLASRQPSVDDSARAIVNTLVGTRGRPHGPQAATTREDELLSHARLVLKLAEILDRQEEEIAGQMAVLDNRQEQLFKELQGDEDEEETLENELRQTRPHSFRPGAGAIKNRLRAWQRLYATAQDLDLPLWLTDQVEAADILRERYEITVKKSPALFTRLELPARFSWPTTDAIARIGAFRQAMRPLLTALATAINTGQNERLAQLAPAWRQELDTRYPRQEFGRTSLAIYRFDARTCASLLDTTADSGRMLALVEPVEER